MARIKVSSEEKQWQAQDDLRTLQRAEEIRKSRTRMSAANVEAKKQIAALNKTMVKKPVRTKAAAGGRKSPGIRRRK